MDRPLWDSLSGRISLQGRAKAGKTAVEITVVFCFGRVGGVFRGTRKSESINLRVNAQTLDKIPLV